MLSERDKQELRYLAKQTAAIWTGLASAEDRGERITDESFVRFKAAELIQRSGPGYIITKEGRVACGADLPRCPSCGREF